MTNIIVTSLGRERLGSNIQLRCSALQQSRVEIVFGDNYYVRTFDIPGPPENFAFNPIPTDTTRLVLSWDQPGNTIIDEDDPVTTTYTVTVTGPTFNFNVTTTDTSYEFTDELNEACATHDIFVSASNAAGQGMNVTRQETIPITPDIRDLSSSLRVSRINLSGGDVAVDVTFNPATICSVMNFPLVSYMVNVAMGNETDSMTYLVTDRLIAGQSPITLPVPSGMLQQDEEYQVTVSACITVTCRTTLVPVSFRTTDVQSASITFFDTNVFLECTFVNMIAGLGCAFRLTVTSGDVETIFVPVNAGSMCSMTQNMQNAYTSIKAVDWESDMVFGMAATRVTINSADADNYTMVTGCVPPTPPDSLSGGAIAGITIGVILAVLIIIAVVIVIAMVEYKRRASKQPKIMRYDEEKVSVDFDKQWLMADHELPKKKKASFRRGRSLVDGTEEASIAFTPSDAAGGPPPLSLAQPSLTDSTAAFSLHISRDKKKAHLHLNRALIRRALKERKMTTLEKKSARATPTQSIREFLLPLHSEIRVTGEESDEDVQIDGGDGGDGENIIAEL
ncbi:uncharacterized protein LOC135344423 [Halichondria panicea]|uniref:uncharacterized protein LOC135344423 n=1 Tax=Halichondria panicea TaxID=6063 RepID=UPI00312B6A41